MVSFIVELKNKRENILKIKRASAKKKMFCLFWFWVDFRVLTLFGRSIRHEARASDTFSVRYCYLENVTLCCCCREILTAASQSLLHSTHFIRYCFTAIFSVVAREST